MPKENVGFQDSVAAVITKADGTIILGGTELKLITEDLLKKIAGEDIE